MQQSSTSFHVRVGVMGEVWRLHNPSGLVLGRGQRVVCRSPRGIELGTIVSASQVHANTEGAILRLCTSQDELLDSRLCKFKTQAVEACRSEIERQGLEATLLDVDHLFDGRTLVFHFLGDLDHRVQEITDRLVDAYERQAKLKVFAQLLAEGCGPGCGTKAGGGCGTEGGCAVCVVASACKPTKTG
jgi:hypothetical protein